MVPQIPTSWNPHPPPPPPPHPGARLGSGTQGTSGDRDVGPLVGGLGLLPPALLLGGGTSVTEPSAEGRQGRGEQKQERGARVFWQPRARQGLWGSPSTGTHSVSPLQHWACGAGPGPPSRPPFPSWWRILGEKGQQQEQGWPCVPGVRSWRWRAAPPRRGRLCLFLPHQQGEIKVYLYSGGFGHCRVSGQECQGGNRCARHPAGGHMELGSAGVIRGAKLRQNPRKPQIHAGFSARVCCPSWRARLRLPPPWDTGTQPGSPGSARWTSGAAPSSPWTSPRRPRSPAGSALRHPGPSPENPGRRRSR